MSSIIIHGHFYQPPRENPWTGVLDAQPSAAPDHDWNERIFRQCYRPNAWARILDDRGRIERLVNNYQHLSFNFGPTLMSWISQNHPGTYARIIAADRASVKEHHGHGNAIAQGYNHAILPLCNERDRRTQVRWGIADFRSRFGREPEALWLPETACNDATLGTLIEAELAYVILSPHQAERVRRRDGGEWRSVADGSIDPRMPYRYMHRDGSGRSIAIFFYDAPMARAVAFEGALASSRTLLERLLAAIDGGAMVNVATDGESYGHHYAFGDRSLAYALECEAAARGLRVSNYGEFLAEHPPEMDVEIKAGPNGEGTAWSCSHGIGRWYRDCGCQTGGPEHWNQQWRGPLRQALDFLRDHCAKLFEEIGGRLLHSPWEARDAYIELILDRARNRDEFLQRHAGRKLDSAERERALALLEMQYNAQLMYTSCGWFFTELSGLETVQVLKYAGRVLDLVEELELDAPVNGFLEILSQARSNLPEMGNGADIYRRFVEPSRVTPRRLAAHLTMLALAEDAENRDQLGDYAYERRDFHKQQHGRLTMVTNHLTLQRSTTGKRTDFDAVALHIGGMDFFCAVRRAPAAASGLPAIEELWKKFPTASVFAMLAIVQGTFGPDEFGLQDMLPDGRQRLGETVFGDLFGSFVNQLLRLYHDNRRQIDLMHEVGMQLPAELRQATEFALSRSFESEIERVKDSIDCADYRLAIEIAEDSARRAYKLDKADANLRFGEKLAVAARKYAHDGNRESRRELAGLLQLSERLKLEPNLEHAQEAIIEMIKSGRMAETTRDDGDESSAILRGLALSPRLLEPPLPLAESAKAKEKAAEGTAPATDGA